MKFDKDKIVHGCVLVRSFFSFFLDIAAVELLRYVRVSTV